MTAHFDEMSDFVNQPSKQKKSGGKFTLVKLLAALGIIVLLIALRLPASRSVPACRSRARGVLITSSKSRRDYTNYESTYKCAASRLHGRRGR